MHWDKELITNMIHIVFPDRGFLMLAAVLLLFCLVVIKWYPEGGILAIYSILILALFASPLGTSFLTKAMYNGRSYWRMLWIVPYAAVMAYALTVLCTASSKRIIRIVCILLSVSVIVLTGNIAYIGDDKAYSMSENIEKVPHEAKAAVVVIEDHASENGLKYKKAAVDTRLSPYIRTIDAGIYMPYGRTPDSKGDGSAEMASIRDGISQKPEAIRMLGEHLIINHCNYAVVREVPALHEELEKSGYREIGSAGEYTVWYNGDVKPDPRLEGKGDRHEG